MQEPWGQQTASLVSYSEEIIRPLGLLREKCPFYSTRAVTFSYSKISFRLLSCFSIIQPLGHRLSAQGCDVFLSCI